MPSFLLQVNFFWNRAGGGGEHGPATTNGVTYHGSSPRGREHPAKYWPQLQFSGSSPRVAGNTSSLTSSSGELWRVIPAWAGNTVSPDPLAKRSAGHPSVGRGTLIERAVNTLVDRVIPAWAGNTEGQTLAEQSGCGSSPRGRGTRRPRRRDVAVQRVIPAWAGNTESRYRA